MVTILQVPRLSGLYQVELWRKGKLIQKLKGHNDIVDVGLNAILDTMFNGASQTDPWAMGLIDGSGSQTLSNSDTMSSHSGWAELEDYDESFRQSWNPGAASSQSVTNSTQITFTISATVTIHGVFVATNNVKGSTTGTLWATAAFASEVAAVDDDELKVTYTVTAARG